MRQKANIHAAAAESLYPDPALLMPENNLRFLQQCIARFRDINFADQDSGRVYLSMLCGRVVWSDPQLLQRAMLSADTRAALGIITPEGFAHSSNAAGPKYLREIGAAEKIPTLGRWGCGARGNTAHCARHPHQRRP